MLQPSTRTISNSERQSLLTSTMTIDINPTSVDAMIKQIIDEVSDGHLNLERRDKIAAIVSCVICGYGVLLFLGPNYYTNKNDSEFLRIWFTTWSLIYNFTLNSYFSVKPLQDVYDEVKKIGVNTFIKKCAMASSTITEVLDLVHKGFWACCASYIYVALVDELPWIPTSGYFGTISYILFFASFLPMNLCGINELFDSHLNPLLKDFYQQFIFMISDSSPFVRKIKGKHLIQLFNKNVRETLLSLVKHPDQCSGEFHARGLTIQQLASSLKERRSFSHSKISTVAVYSLTGALALTVMYGYLGYFRDTMPNQDDSKKEIFDYLIAIGSILSNTGLALLMSKATSQELVESCRNALNRNLSPHLKSILGKCLFIVSQLLVYGCATQTIKGSLVLNELFKNEVSPFVYGIITDLTIIGTTFFNGYALSNCVMTLHQRLHMRHALKPSTIDGASRENYFFQKLYGKLSTSNQTMILQFVSTLATQGNVLDSNINFSMLAEKFNLSPDELTTLINYLLADDLDNAGSLLIQKNPEFSASAYRRKTIDTYLVHGAIPTCATWLINELLLSYYIVSKSETMTQFFLPALSYLPFSMMKLAANAVQFICHKKEETSLIPKASRSFCSSLWSKVSGTTASLIAPTLAGYGTELIVATGIGPATGCDDETSAYIGKACGTLAAAFVSSRF